MRAMILSAGRGERLRPLTDKTPKPLLSVGGEQPVVRHVRRLTAAGFAPLVVNLCHLGEQIQAVLGDGRAFGTTIQYSPEDTLLGAAGGIRLAMERGLLGDYFLVVNGDIVCDYELSKFHHAPHNGVHLLLVDNPPQKTAGDFSLVGNILCPPTANALTYAGMGEYRASLFSHLTPGKPAELLPILQRAMVDGVATGEHHAGVWHDIGTPDSLQAARQAFGTN